MTVIYNNRINVNTHRSYCHSAGNIFCAGNLFRAGKFFRAGRTSCAETPVSLGIPGSDPPDSGIHSARFPLSLLVFPWLFPNGYPHVYPERAGIPELEGGCHSSLGSSQDISISHSGVSCGNRNAPHASVNHYTTSPDSVGLPPGLLYSDGSFPPRPNSHSDRLFNGAPAHPRTRQDKTRHLFLRSTNKKH